MGTTLIGAAHNGGERTHLVVEAPTAVARIMESFIADHEEELNERLASVGYSIDDLLRPTWMTPLRLEDVQAFGDAGDIRSGIAELMRRLANGEGRS